MGQSLRIIYPVSEGFDSGKARFHQIFQTAHALARQGCEVDLLIGKNRVDIVSEVFPYYGLEEQENLRVHCLPLLRREGRQRIRLSWNAVFHFFCLLKIRGLLRQRLYQAIFLRHLNLADFLIHCKKFLPLPLVFESHEIFHLTTERKEKEEKIRSQETWIYPRLDGLVAITRSLAEQLREIFQIQAPIEVIPDGVNLSFFRPTHGRSDTKKIVYIGQLYSWKGVETLVQAIKYLDEGELHLVGGGDKQVQKMSQIALQMGVGARVFFHGQVSPRQVKEHLADAAVAVLPLTRDMISAHFTSPLKLFEYMAFRVPVVASDLPSIREILTHEVNAILVPPDNPEALARGIQRLLTDREMANRLAGKAHEDVLSYSWDRRAERLIHFLGRVASEC